MRCLGTLEFLCDFHEQCHRTQQRLVESKKANIQKIKSCPESMMEDDVESDKENASPVVKTGIKRNRQTALTEIPRVSKTSPLVTNKNLSVNVEGANKRAGKISSPSTKAKCDSSSGNMINEVSEKRNDEIVRSDKKLFSERTTRSQSSNRNNAKISQNEINSLLDSPKSKPVPVIVKLEKPESPEVPATTSSTIATLNSIVWQPILEGDKPKSTRMSKQHDECPAAGDEAEKRMEKSAESSLSVIPSTSNERNEGASMEGKRKSVIETTIQNSVLKEKTMNSVEKEDKSHPVAHLTEEDESADPEEEESAENRKKFGRISELISEEQKKAIEKYYSVDMSVVDEEIVGDKLLFLEKKNFGCKICKASYPRQDKCQVHIWGHLDMKPYRCKACDFATVTVSNIRCHIRKSHLKIKPYACELCEKRYVTAFLLEEHMNSHTGSRPYSCKICEFTSASRQVLSYHNATHKPVKDITCHTCGKEFYSKGRLRAHMVIHNKDKAVNMCKFCSIYLCNSEALERHYKNVHSQDYVCNVCGKRCKSKKALNNHQNVHSAARFKCTLCSNVYKSSHILKEHLLKHKGIRKYKCRICEKDFAQQSHLAAHMAVHSEKRFCCPGCKRAFNRHDNMKMHTKRCDAFLANPELSTLLKIRKSRSKSSITTSIEISTESKTKESNESTIIAAEQENLANIESINKTKLDKTDLNVSKILQPSHDFMNNRKERLGNEEIVNDCQRAILVLPKSINTLDNTLPNLSY